MSLNAEVETTTISGRSPRQIAWSRFKRNKVGMVAAGISIFLLSMSLFAPIVCRILGINPTDLNLENLDSSGIPRGPDAGFSMQHPLGLIPGTGRDLLAQLLYGSRISFSVAIITSVASIGIGMILGITAGYFRGRVDAVIGRFSDLLFALPSFFMIIALSLPLVQRVEAMGIAKDNAARIVVLVTFFVFFGWPGFARLIRSQAMSMRERDFVMAAQAMGASSWRIIVKEILPNLWPTAIVFTSLSLPAYIAAEATFSFLGVGVRPPASTFGLVLSDAVGYWRNDPAYLLIPSVILIAIVLSLNLLGDAIRDALDPKAGR